MQFVMTIPQDLLQSQEVSPSGKLLWMFCERMQSCTGDIVRLSAKEIALQMGLERATIVKQAKVLSTLGWMNLIEGRVFSKLPVWHYQAIMKKEVE